MKKLTIGKLVIVHDRYRFAKPLKAKILSVSRLNDGVELLLLESNNNFYPTGCVVWVDHQQLRNIKND